tara:strand:+ start:878 stop:1123 length:246 start_codon:yes stop_codon:yes gene_type:complete
MKFICSIYKERPETCRQYPWNGANQLFVDCIFIDTKKERLRTMEEQLQINTMEEIGNYCVNCGKCCFFGPAKCSKLEIITD